VKASSISLLAVEILITLLRAASTAGSSKLILSALPLSAKDVRRRVMLAVSGVDEESLSAAGDIGGEGDLAGSSWLISMMDLAGMFDCGSFKKN
jgi:hypothetical protein